MSSCRVHPRLNHSLLRNDELGDPGASASPTLPRNAVADRRFRVPGEHGVDRLRQLSAAHLVDAAGVDPQELVAVRFGEHAAAPDLLADEGPRVLAGAGAFEVELLDLLEGLLPGQGIFVPYVRYDGVLSWRAREPLEFRPIGSEQPHAARDRRTRVLE
ncbi:hypothetical protein NUW54_g7966 [Trametes sanguinea]|uniref:Uncharacterized protein n=1 Tax=Trametes sanguinea TaxID=158606 RepID=A0ACC1PHN2_9APHY|nr:hypothetical protein NUW54_g7966 [Trametes sanguinea]